MSRKVKSKTYPCYHYSARCNDCGWLEEAGGNDDIPAVRNATIKHVKETGHTVSVEKASGIRYSPA